MPTEEEIQTLVAMGKISPETANAMRAANTPQTFPPSSASTMPSVADRVMPPSGPAGGGSMPAAQSFPPSSPQSAQLASAQTMAPSGPASAAPQQQRPRDRIDEQLAQLLRNYKAIQ
jgi:hypothetical protein